MKLSTSHHDSKIRPPLQLRKSALRPAQIPCSPPRLPHPSVPVANKAGEVAFDLEMLRFKIARPFMVKSYFVEAYMCVFVQELNNHQHLWQIKHRMAFKMTPLIRLSHLNVASG